MKILLCLSRKYVMSGNPTPLLRGGGGGSEKVLPIGQMKSCIVCFFTLKFTCDCV